MLFLYYSWCVWIFSNRLWLKKTQNIETKSAPKADAVSVIAYLKCCHNRNDEKALIKKKRNQDI